ncbi:HdeD family acid-resistance protein [Gammaproteobacteria bacterium]|nr:HdeD family acid-resistance protein [Gammaproteobacteria bacterium]
MDSLNFKNTIAKTFNKNWAWILLWGVSLILLGVIAIGAATTTTLLSVVFLGFILLFGSVVIIVDSFSFWRFNWGNFILHFVVGLLYGAVGIILIKNPAEVSVSLTLFIGIFYLCVGIFRIINSITSKTPQWGWFFFNGLISFILGILILTNWPLSGLFIIGLFIGIDLLFSGISYVILSLASKSIKNEREI